jgi:DNA-directed RNA polymerase subunit RPC12/RpoP
LRITLPPGTPKERPNTGLSTGIHIKGDFEITVSYEILEEVESVQPGGKATAVALIVNAEQPPDMRAWVNRRVHAKGGMQFSTWSNKQPFKLFPATTSSGRLRMVRTDGMISYSRAENGETKFTELFAARFTSVDIVDVKLAGTTGGADAKLDARFTDLRIRAASLSNAKAAILKEPVAPEIPAQLEVAAPSVDSSNGWVVVMAIVGFALIAIFIGMVGLVVFVRHGRATAKEAPETQSKMPAKSIASLFQCDACGKNIKVKIDLAGKTVKCPHCGSKVLAPAPDI